MKVSGGSRLAGTLQKRIHLVRFKRTRSHGRRTENERRRSVQTNGAPLIQIGVDQRHGLGELMSAVSFFVSMPLA